MKCGFNDGELKMANAKQLKALLTAHADGDDDHFYSIAMQVAASEAKRGHSNIANELRKLIDEAKSVRNIRPKQASTTAIVQPRGELTDLLQASYPKNTLAQMVLAPSLRSDLSRIITEQKLDPIIRSHGLTPSRKLLLIGKPGTGKTMTASALAGELGMPLFLVRLDSLMTKFMGETAAKLRIVFDTLSNTRGVYLFDEFDAIGAQRGLMNEVGEIRRVLNSFLLMLEQDDSRSVIIAATNHPEILDHALFRRFDEVIEYSYPTPVEAIKILKNRIASFSETEINWECISEYITDLSQAEIARIADNTMKNAIVADTKSVTQELLIGEIENRKKSVNK